MAGRKSFEIRTARQFLERLVEPDYDEFLRNRTSSRLAIHCAVGCWHLIDWVWEDILMADKSLRLVIDSSIKDHHSFRAYAKRTCPDLDIIGEIANGSKHFATRTSTVKDSKRAGAFQAGAFQPDAFDIARLEVELANSRRPFADCLEAAVTFWRAFFRDHVPQRPRPGVTPR